MSRLEDFVNSNLNTLTSLDGSVDRDKIISMLQKFNKAILETKIITNSGKEIYPLWVEAYYYNDRKNFRDISCHDHCGGYEQYKFREHTLGYGGIDLYLGNNSNYYLSFLIKLALIVDGQNIIILSQKEIPGVLSEEDELIFEDLDNTGFKVENTARIGITGNHDYRNLKLATGKDYKSWLRTYDVLRKNRKNGDFIEEFINHLHISR